jgi:multidrug efflux pump subunit AcrB
MIYAIIQTPPGSTLERTNQIAKELLRESEDIDGVQSVSSLAGYEILTEGTGSNSGTCLINLKSWEDRKESAAEIIEKLEEKAKNIPGANIEFFQPPSIPGYGAAGGFELRLLDKAGSGDYHKMEQVSNDFVKELKKRPELGSAFTFYSASFPQYMLRVDNDLAEQKGVTIENAMDNLSTLIGSNYETSFIRFDRPYKVIVQAGPQYRALPTDL